ncbi:esterase-like activity of phytase family protein [Dongia rigui]|uniref:Esterase-like activity of phytase family protein n=1 Tax=Dongia rigui TaxID=940149 RepID=A0ABU5E0F8_9PROT|nr:esterase-like activity of phytase family protein [Dongia rigui]MDY0872996.1 esterase-like activity of phytase family protein [Dongia rigui]
MTRFARRFGMVSLFTLMLTGIAQAEGPEIFTSDDPALPLGTVKTGAKELKLSRGIGSALFHMKGDPDNVFYSVTDRGPNIDCAEAEELTGADVNKMCAGDEKAKIFPQPDFVPSIQRVELGTDGKFTIKELINISDASGKPISGLPNPLKGAKTEHAFDKDGKAVDFDPNGLDTEGLVRMSDGSFWLSDEYAPSLVHVAADGKIIERLVPQGLEGDFSAATYKVRGTLPAILAKRQLNRGMEGVAISPDEKFIYGLMQNPLANPDADAFKKANATRILKVDTATGKPVGEFVYQLDAHTTFKNDKKAEKQSDVRLSEITAVGQDKLVILERIAKTTKLHLVDLATGTDILGTSWDDPKTSPSLEQADLAAAGVTPLTKTLWFDSSDHEGIPAKVEGVAIIAPDTLVIINDDDFGIDGKSKTQIVRLKLALPSM